MRKDLYVWIFWLFILGFGQKLSAQVTVTNSNNASFLAKKLIGPGVEVSNAAMLCNANQSGFFVSPSSLLGMDSGIVLTTGLAATNTPYWGLNGPQSGFANQNQGTGGDVDLDALAGLSTYDRCILEFDFKGDGDTIFFEYRFGSEEYPSFNCTNYNDVFGFFISGPGIIGNQNLALIPNTPIPVAINSVNNGVVIAGGNIANCTSMGAGSPFTQYYVDNTNGTQLTYDGFTTMFKAKSYIQACSTYHIKLAIADGFDQIFDSGVFLKAGSFKSNTYHLSASTDSITANPQYAFEGCDSIIIRIKRDNFQTSVNSDTLTLQMAGSAQNGIDYNTVANNYYFTSSLTDTMKTIILTPFNEFITEGTESIKFYLKNKCNTIMDSLEVDIKDPPTFQLFNQDTSICVGASVQVNGLYDNGLSFTWQPTTGVSNPHIINPVITPATTTSYTLTAQYGNCVPVKDTITIQVQALPTISLSSTSVTCNGLANGTITAFGTAGSTPLTFSILPIGTILTGSPSTFTNLGPGIYTVTISSGLGCTKSSTKIITEPTSMNWISVSPTNIGCNAGNVGQISAGASGGMGSITYTLNPGNINSVSGNYTGLGPGVYVVTAKDANNCTITSNVTITQATSLTWFLVNSTNINCSGQAGGSIFTSATGGIGTISYQIQPGGTNNTSGNFSSLVAGTYTVTAMDASGCTATTSVTLTQPSNGIVVGTPNITNASCNGTSTGAVSISATGGSGTLTYLLNPPGSSNTVGTFTGKPAGNYTITVSDANGCTATTTFTITQPSAINISNTTVMPTCVPGNNGSITITATGGGGGYQYKLNTGTYQSGNSFSGLSSTAYTVTVKDLNNCTATTVISLGTANQITIANNTLPITCTTTVANINVAASGGTAPYSYTLTPGNITNSTGNFPGVDTGAYVVTVLDANGCSNSISINLIQPPNLLWTNFNVTNIPCSGIGTGNVAVSAGGGTPVYTYTITPAGASNTTGIFNNLGQNWYTVSVTDANGCSASSLAHIIISPALTLAAPTLTHVSCYGTNTGSVTINPVGGSLPIVYTLHPGNIVNLTGIFNNLAAGVYTVSVLDAGNCTNSVSFTITQPAVLQISSVTNTPPTCVPPDNGAITVQATGGTTPYNYSVNGGSWQASNTLNGLVVGVYTVTVKDAHNCTKTTVVNLINPTAPNFSSVNVNQALCAGSATGNLSVAINSGTLPMTYVINPLGISNTSGVFNNLPVNTYTITVTDAVNCIITSTANIVQPSAIQWSSVNSNNVQCNGVANGNIHVSASGGVGTLQYTVNPGSFNNTTGIFNSLTNATYTVVVSDANNCSLSTIINITQPSALFWNGVTSNNAACYNLPTAQINSGALGGTGTLSYSLQPGNVTNGTGAYPNILAGIYTVQVTDANGCTLSSVFNLTQPSSFPSVSITNTIPTCVPGNDAIITVNTSGGTPGYLYSINGLPNQSSNVFTSIGISNYTVVVTDANGCSLSSLVAVVNNNAPNITSVNATNILCFGNTTGSIVTNVTGGQGTLTYSLQPSASTNGTGIFNNLAANSYTVSVTDGNNCQATSNVILTQPPMLMWDSVDNRDVACYGGGNGVVTSSASGGAGSIVYHLMPNNVSNNNGIFFGLGVGQYTLTATDANGCAVTAIFQINQPPPITWTNVTTTSVSCLPNTDGTITVQATGGNGNFDYKLQPNNITNSSGYFSNLGLGTYTVTAKDYLNCTSTTVVQIIIGTPVTITSTPVQPASCIPGCDGSVVINANGGSGTYTYSNNNAAFQTSNNYSSLCSGVYTVIAKDVNNCSGTATYTISTANGPTQLSMNPVSVICYAETNGQLQVNTTGGVGPYNYVLTPGNLSNTTGQFTGLSSQTYTVVATDANGCSISAASLVPQPGLFQVLSSPSIPVSCQGGNNGSLFFSTIGGNGSPQYVLSPNNTSNTTGLFNGLSAGSYTVQVTDLNGCTTSTSAQINEPMPLQFTSTSVTNITCNGDSNGVIQTSVTGGTGSITYLLQPGTLTNNSGLFSPLNLNTYTIQATDANGCSIQTTASVGQPTPLIISNISTTIPTCIPGGDATMTITASGATPSYQYSLNGSVLQSSNQFNNLSIGSYTIIVQDANNCSLSSVTTISSPFSPVIAGVLTTPATCDPGCDGSSEITASNGTSPYTYSVNASAFQSSNLFNNLCLNNYTVVVKDVNGCTGTGTFVIANPPSPIITGIVSLSASCNPGCDGSLTMNTSGGTGLHTYSLNNSTYQSSNNFPSLCAGLYTLSVKDAAGCTNTNLAMVNTFNGPTIISTSHNNVSCNGGTNGSLSLNVSGGTSPINYLLLPVNISSTTSQFNNLSVGIYTVQGTDAHGCTLSTSIAITQPSPILFGTITSTPVTCFGISNGTIQCPAAGGSGTINYSISPIGVFTPPYSFTNLAGGASYTITATDANGCTTTASQNILQPAPVQINSISADSVTCNGLSNAQISCSASGGTGSLGYHLMPGNFNNTNGNFNNLSGGTYTITVSDANNCSATSTAFIFEPSALQIINSSSTNLTCQGTNNGSISVQANGGTLPLNYLLTPGGTNNTTGSFNNLSANLYTITVVDGNSCTLTTSILIIEPTTVVFNSVTKTNVQCFGLSNGQIQANASGGIGTLNYVLNPGNINNTTGQFNGLNVNVYTLTVSDANGCNTSTTVNITQPPSLHLFLDSLHHVTCFGGNNGYISGHATGGTPNYTYSIQPGNLLNSTGLFNTLSANSYQLLITDAQGCKDSIQPIVITQPTQIVFTSVVHDDITCYFDTTGSITAQAAGGTGNLSYSLLPNVGQQVSPGNFQNLGANSYTVVVTDAANCSVTTLVNVIQNLQIQAQVQYTEPVCFGEQNGAIQIAAIGGVAPLTYSINGGPFLTNGNFTNLGAGTYVIEILDAKNCLADTTLVLTQPDKVGGMLTIHHTICKEEQDGSVTVVGTGGRGDYVYYLKPGVSLNHSGYFGGLNSGTYTISIKDSSLCEFDTVMTIQPPVNLMALTFDKKDVGCYGYGNDAWIQVYVNGGTPPYLYSWNDPAQSKTEIIDHLRWGAYQVDVTDSNGCRIQDTVHINPGICCDEVFIPNAFSPNNDNLNDCWKIATAAGIELRQLAIFNRWGNKIWSTNDILSCWDGTHNSKRCDVDTYFYIFRYKCLSDGKEYVKKGDISLVE